MMKGTIRYPSIIVDDELPDLIPVVLGTLREGGKLPILLQDGKGALIEIPYTIDFSPLEFEKILRLYPLILILSETESVCIKTAEAILDREDIPWMDY